MFIRNVVQKIGNEVCEGCGPNADCGIDPEDCDRLDTAISWINDFMEYDRKVVEKILDEPLDKQ
jgi:hypothetical protein